MSHDHPTGPSQRHTRRRVLGLLGSAAAGAVITRQAVLAADPTPTPGIQPIQSTNVGEMPSTGALRPGPVGQQPAPVTSQIATTPVAIRIDAAQVDAEIETLDITNGVMANPTGPWVVSWYRQTSELGEGGNVVMAGHVDYWGSARRSSSTSATSRRATGSRSPAPTTMSSCTRWSGIR